MAAGHCSLTSVSNSVPSRRRCTQHTPSSIRHLLCHNVTAPRWVLLDLQGKGRRIRTVPVPLWVKRILDRWLEAGEIIQGPLFRTLRKGDRLGPADKPISEDLVYTLVRQSGAAIGHPELTPHDLRRTCASYAAKREGIWNKSNCCSAMPPSKPPNATSAPNRISSRPSTIV